MIKALSLCLAVVLAIIAALHIYWGLGGFWPGTDAASLVDKVVGAPPGTPVPPLWACGVVAACVMVPAWAGLTLSRVVPDVLPKSVTWIWSAALWGAAIVFLLRGLSTYVSPLLQSTKGTEFYALDRAVYAPLCLFLGTALLLIWFNRARPSTQAITP